MTLARYALFALLAFASGQAGAHVEMEDGALRPPPPPTAEECAALADLSKDEADLYSMKRLRQLCEAQGLAPKDKNEKRKPAGKKPR